MFGGRQALTLGPVLAIVFFAALDLTVVAPILPQMISDLNINTVDADRYAWIVLSYLIAYTVTVPITGRLSDFTGRIPIFTAALLLFAVGSAIAASAESLNQMIAGRTLQGLGGGAMLPVSMALVADAITGARRVSVLGLVAAVDTFGWVLGPVWGVVVNALFGTWRAIFWLNIPLAAAALIFLMASNWRRPEIRWSARPNLLSAALGAVFLVAITLALSSGNEGGLSAGQGARALGGSENPVAEYRNLLLLISALFLIGFVLNEIRSKDPLLPVTLIRTRVFQAAGIANILIGAVLIVAMVNAPLFITLLADESDQPTYSALVLGSFTLLMTAGALIGGSIVTRFGNRLVAVFGLLVATAGYLIMSIWSNDIELLFMVLSIGIAGFGLGLVIAPISDAAISAASAVDYGIASGLVLLARLLGMTFGLAAITRFTIERLDAEVAKLPPIVPEAGESTSAYFSRQQSLLTELLIPLTLDIVAETFLIAAFVCLLTLGAIALMRSTSSDRQ